MDEGPEIVVPSHSWTTWTSAILGAFVVGLSGLVPLLLLPDTSPVKRFVSQIVTIIIVIQLSGGLVLLVFNPSHIRHGYRSKKFPAATYARDYFINFTKSPKKLKKFVIFGNRNWLEV